MTKEQEFLWGVQLLLMFDSFNLNLDHEALKADRTKISMSGRIESMVIPIRASRVIPENVSAEKAAFQIAQLLRAMNRGDEEVRWPSWFQPHQSHYDFTGRD